MESVIIVLLLLIGFFFVVHQRYGQQEVLKDSDYKKKGALLNAQESIFYQALLSALGQNGVVLCKVNMSNVLAPVSTNKKKWFIANNRINKSYFDFVICDSRTLEPRVVLEMDDGKPLNKGKIDRQKLVLHVCKSAGVPLIGANVKLSYQVSKLKRLLATHIDLIEVDKEVRFCKKCGSPMVVKIATQGDYKGRRFFTCSRQPTCTYTENYNVVFGDEDDVEPSGGI
ncbi:DUF2726 domain-containing protein [Vibrio sonorensis]|uniref:DUF2726 domain-containing protein n=1 Tax=Vibrio sonorensis TaxID=1004316 RepID=UPI0008DB2A61|nr:DUF2726 domain-containing protein [Vibrio sonorensis]